jgi:outer membrane protein TolC
MRSILIISLSSLLCWTAAQGQFTLEQAISEALQKNYSIRIERNNAFIAENNNNPGNAGYLPNVSLNAGRTQSSNNTRQVFFSGQINERNNAKSSANTASLELNWTLFDGFKMFSTDKRLQLEEDRALVELNAQIEMTIYQISALYFTTMQLQDMMEVYEESFRLSEERYAFTKLQFDNGAATQVQLLQAQLDAANDRALLLQYSNELKKLKIQMGVLIGREMTGSENYQAVITEDKNWTWEMMMKSSDAQNTELLLAKSTIAIAQMKRKEAQSLYYPQVNFFGQYAFSNAENQVGILNSNRMYGTGVGLSLTWTILDRLSTYTTNKNVVIELENAKLMEQEIVQNKNTELKSAYMEYELALSMLKLEEENNMDVGEMFELAKVLYDAGSITPIELREFQFSLIQAKNRLFAARLNVQTAELNLRLLVGDFKTMMD